jgi:hypothetical protein
MLGVGAPALVGSLVGQTAPLASESVSWLELVPAAYAQEQDMRVRLVFVQNDPDVPLESLWVRADGKTVGTSIQENVMHVKLPGSTKRLTISPPGSAKGLTLTRETLHRSEGIVELKITDNKFWKQFFQTLNNPDVAQYRIELAK